MIHVSIIGMTGYTGIETLRLLETHPQVKIAHLVSNSQAGKTISEVIPHLSHIHKKLSAYDPKQLAQDSDVVILAVPHGVSPNYVPDLIGQVKIIDLAGDFRLQNIHHFETYYKHEHPAPALLPDFTYGLPEVNRSALMKASNIANTGCFASALQIACFPFVSTIKHVHALGITGSSGSGKTASAGTHHPIRNHNVVSYKIGIHQHLPEVFQSCGITPEQITFVPTSGPFTRGIFVTAILDLNEVYSTKSAEQKIKETYADSPAVRVVKSAQVANVTGSPFVDVSVQVIHQKVIVQVAIDNLMKGCASTAVQNLNLMCGLPEMTGLNHLSPLFP